MNSKKFKAFFHDPLDKPLDIIYHEKRAGEYVSNIGVSEDLINKEIKDADHIASASDRIIFPKDKDGNKIIINFNKDAELTHPLGSGTIKLSEYGYINADLKETGKVINASLSEMKNSSTNDEKRLLLDLWRNIPEKFKDFELVNFKLGNLWNLLPADTRIPDHSIIDHNWLCSAIASSLPEPAFLKFSIGPIQSFISTAKRTEDHWMGSYLLSYLMSKAIEVIIDEAGPEHIIFPYIKGQPLIDRFLKEKYSIEPISLSPQPEQEIKIPSLSNIVFTILPWNNSKCIAEKMKEKVQKTWVDLSETVKSECEKFKDNKISEIWDLQIKNFLDVYYVIYKWADKIPALEAQNNKFFCCNLDKPTGKYHNIGTYWQDMYKITDSAFNSRKNLRNFNQLQSKDELTKCSMCGEREVLHPEEVKKSSELSRFWEDIGKRYPGKIDYKGKDKLCAVCFVKRMAGELYFKGRIFDDKPNFPSTSSITALPFKLKIIEHYKNDITIFCKVKAYNDLLRLLKIEKSFNWNLIRYIPKHVLYNPKNKFKPESDEFKEFKDFLSFDGQWIYEESFTKKALVDGGIINEEDCEPKLINSIIEVIKTLKKSINDKPSKYFAVLAMDGDKMGKWLSGTHMDWPNLECSVHSAVKNSLDGEMKKKRRNLSPAIHSFISKSLNFFSLKVVRDIIEYEFPGKLIYSGGDDVLAFLPMDYALELAEKVRFAFSGNIDESGKIDLSQTKGYILFKEKGDKKIIPTMGNKATMSAGIVIAHKNHDLADILRNVRDAEKEAKEEHGRNAFTVRIIRHSGGITKSGFKWSYDASRIIQNLKIILENISENDGDDGLSMSFFSSIVSDLIKLDGDNFDIVKSLFKRQIAKNLRLKRHEGESKVDFKTRKSEKLKELIEIFTVIIENIPYKKSGADNSNMLVDTLLMLRFLVSGGKR